MATQKLFAMLSISSDESQSIPKSSEHKWKSLILNRRSHRSCTDDYTSLRPEEDNSHSILQQPIEILHYLRHRNSSIDTSFIESERQGSTRSIKSRKCSLKAADSVFLSDSETNNSIKRKKEIENFYKTRTSKVKNVPQSPFQNNVSVEHFQFDLYSTNLTDEQTDNNCFQSGKVCGELFGYVHYRIEIEQLELKLISVNIDNTKLDKKENISNMFVRIQLQPPKVDAFISSLNKCENQSTWNSSWVTNVTFEESQQATAQFLIRTLVKGNLPKSIGVAEVDLKRLDIINGENFKENIFDGKLIDELGEMQVSLSYAPDQKQMTMVIGKVRNLSKKDYFKKPDTFVKISLYHGKKLLKTKKTSIKKSSYNPSFNESFMLNVVENQTSLIFVIVSIYEKHSTSKDECLGRLIFGNSKKASSALQAEHWAEIIGSSWTTVSRWHLIISKDKCLSISSTSSDDTKS